MNTQQIPSSCRVFPVPSVEIHSRVERIQAKIASNDLDGLLIIQRADLFYFSGTAQNGCLFIPAQGDPLLMIKRSLPRAVEESPIQRIAGLSSIREIPRVIADHCGRLPARLGMELDVMPVNDFQFYRGLFGDPTCLDASALILETRMIKSPWEIERLEDTAALSHSCFQYLQEHLRPGISEMVLAGMVETHARDRGHGGKLRVRDYQTEGYPWHILSGPNGGLLGLLESPMSGAGTSPAFPCGAGPRKIKPNEPIMADLGSILNGYHFDETRMLALGAMPQKALDASKAAIDIHDHVLDAVRPGVTIHELFQRAEQKAATLGYEASFLGPPGQKVHFVGHGIGVELIEPPIIARGKADVLQEGMVFALEPKLNFQGEFAAGIESIFLVTSSGHRLISQTPPDVLIVPL